MAVGALSGGNYAIQFGNRASPAPLALMLVILGKSGAGKDVAQGLVVSVETAAENIAAAMRVDQAAKTRAGRTPGYAPPVSNPLFVADDELISGIAIRKALADCPQLVWLHDEFGRDLASVNKTRAGHLFEAHTTGMKAYSNFVKGRRKKGKGAEPVPHPALSKLALTAPGPLYDALHVDDVESGMLGRYVYMSVDNPDSKTGDWPYLPDLPIPKRRLR